MFWWVFFSSCQKLIVVDIYRCWHTFAIRTRCSPFVQLLLVVVVTWFDSLLQRVHVSSASIWSFTWFEGNHLVLSVISSSRLLRLKLCEIKAAYAVVLAINEMVITRIATAKTWLLIVAHPHRTGCSDVNTIKSWTKSNVTKITDFYFMNKHLMTLARLPLA